VAFLRVLHFDRFHPGKPRVEILAGVAGAFLACVRQIGKVFDKEPGGESTMTPSDVCTS
jgi:hypothetical protein